jgi:hydroxymethylpyrimidine/phosphomethylpyrimidine kinase
VNAVLVIGGTDSSGGAGLARDLRTLSELDTPALCAVTAVTAQTDQALRAACVMAPALVRAQVEAAFATCAIGAVKIGMLANAAIVHAVADALAPHPEVAVVLDPVLLSTSGAQLLEEGGRRALMERLLGSVALLTPNIPEAAALLQCAAAGSEAQALGQAQQLLARGARAVLLKGGHAGGRESVDLLLSPRGLERLSAPRLAATLRGTGCALASAIAAHLAQGVPLSLACTRAKAYVGALLQQRR